MPGRATSAEGKYGGFILTFEPERTAGVLGQIEVFGTATESFSTLDWRLEPQEIAVLARTEPRLELVGMSLMRKTGARGGSHKKIMRFEHAVFFATPIRAHEAGRADTLAQWVSTAQNMRRIERNVWAQFVRLIKELRPDSGQDIDALLDRQLKPRQAAEASARSQRLAEQRDALGIALEVAGLDRRATLRSMKIERLDAARTTLDLLDAQTVAERSLIEHDKAIFEGAHLVSASSAHFSGTGGREMRAYVSDATPIETATGVDLMIYMQDFDSFVLLQYKGMAPVDRAQGSWAYKVDHTNLDDQLAAMGNFRAAAPEVDVVQSVHQLRLSKEWLFFKFCERKNPRELSDALVPGITLSADHLTAFLALPDARNENGIRIVGYGNCARYLSNTEFLSLAQGGWVGTGTNASTLIRQVLAARDTSRSAVYAVIQGALNAARAAATARVDAPPSPAEGSDD